MFTLLIYYPHWNGQARPVYLDDMSEEEARQEGEAWARKTPVGTMIVLTVRDGAEALASWEGEATRAG